MFYSVKSVKIVLIFSIFCLQVIYSQGIGVNSDPFQMEEGEMPYEMTGRVEERIPLTDFDDCTKWKVTSKNCDVKLYRTREQRVFRNYSGKIIYKTTAKKAEFSVELLNPIELKEPWNCINFWNYGDHWMWEPNEKTAMTLYVLIRDAEGELHSIRMVQQGSTRITYKYWFLNHMKLKNKIIGPSKFVGFKFRSSSSDTGVEHTLFLESAYAYQEELKPMTFKELPKDLPFPLREETILPINKLNNYKNIITKKGNIYSLLYKAEDAKIVYEINPRSFLKDITVRYNSNKKVAIANNSEIILDTEDEVTWRVIDQKIKSDTLFINYFAENNLIKQQFSCWYTIKQKSLICGIDELGDTGLVSQIMLGTTDAAKDSKLVAIPFLNYNYKERPNILYSNDLFHFTMFDWYYSNASLYYSGRNKISKGQAYYNGGIKYIPLINGKRNLLREKLFINVSPDVQEVFPTIDNPSSPMRSVQADRLWAINGGTDLKVLGKFVTDLRSKGLEKVTIRYHEGFWRKGGESYTFKLNPNPELGVKRIRDYISFVKSNDWNVGLYSNYTDFAPVNSNWNEDWVKRGPNGVWEVSWARNYSPKPQIAWEQEAVFAPKIHQMFNTNHSYCDVHTAISPMSRVDYDHRVPGAGTFRHVINCYGLLLMNERKSYQGTVYSEGGNHWWYAGLLDGNYANGNLDALPVFPDFQMLQIHTKEMDAGNTGDKDSYLAYTLAYGNIGKLSAGLDAVKRYAFLQPIQDKYVMIPIRKIEYFEAGQPYNSSEAIKKEIIQAPQLHLEYETDFQVYTNFSDKNWEVKVNQKIYNLPKYGVLAFQPDSNLISFSGRNEESSKGLRVDKVISDKLCYLDTFGEKVNEGALRGQGSYMLKKEKTGWEIIPLGEVHIIDFDLNLLELSDKNIKIQAVDRDGNRLDVEPINFDAKIIKFQHLSKVYKYKIIQE